jgi:signal transduction histidine kinase/CheY-like chemotaxis protein
MLLDLAERLRFGAVVYVVAAVSFAFVTDLTPAARGGAVVGAVALALAGFARTVTARRVTQALGSDRRRNREFLASAAVHAAVWIAFLGHSMWHVGGQPFNETLLLAMPAVLVSAAATVMAGSWRLAAFSISGQWAVLLGWAVRNHSVYRGFVWVLPVFFGIYILWLARGQHRHLRARLTQQILLEEQQEQLRQAKEVAEEASAARARFLATMSHEIRTPLNGVLGLTQLLSDTPLNREQRELLHTLGASGEHLLGIVNDILDYSKITAGKLQLEISVFDPRALLQETMAGVGALAQQRGLAFSWDAAPEVPAYVEGDALRLRQILLNLASNAVKFTPAGEVKVEVTAQSGELAFAVMDTGIGIAPQEQRALFRDFSQVDQSTTRRHGGTGLGLVISRHLAEAMGGSIEVESAPRQGSCFTLRLPMPAARPVSRTPLLAGGGAEFTASIRILIAEDNPVNRRITEAMLAATGATIESVENGSLAVERHLAQPFHLILMDCNMPVMDGFQATAAIRALSPPWGSVPVVALTANAFEEDRQRCLDAGMDAYLSKPIRRQDLLEAAVRWLRPPAPAADMQPEAPAEGALPSFPERFSLAVSRPSDVDADAVQAKA